MTAQPSPPRPCLIYARYSTDRQDRMRCRDQVAACAAFAEAQGWHVVQAYQDEALSGSLGREGRPGWDQLLSDVEGGGVPAGSVVLTFSWSRWSRDHYEGTIARLELQRRGVDVADCRHGIYGRDIGGRVLLTIEEHRAAEFLEELRRSVKSGLDARLREGYWTRSVPPYGYRIVRVARGAGTAASLEPAPLEVPVVRRIYELLDAGAAPTAVARELNASGAPTRRGGPWTSPTVRAIATNPVYVGQVATYGGRAAGRHNTRYLAARGLRTVYDGHHEPIIGDALWGRVSEMWLPRPHQLPPRRRNHPLSGLVVCGRCGRAAHVTGGEWPYRNYRCGSYSVGGCGNPAIVRILALEDAVRSWLRGLVEDSAALEEAAGRLAAEASAAAAASADVRAPLAAELEDLDARAGRYLAALEAGGAPAVVNRRLVEIETRAAAVRQQLAAVGPGAWAVSPAEAAAAIRAAAAAGAEDLRAAGELIDRIVLPDHPAVEIVAEVGGARVPLEIGRSPKARGPRAAQEARGATRGRGRRSGRAEP